MDHTGDADHWHQPLITGDHCDHTSIIIITSLSVWSDALLAGLSEVCVMCVCVGGSLSVCLSCWVSQASHLYSWSPHKAAALIPSLAQARREVFSSDAPSHPPVPPVPPVPYLSLSFSWQTEKWGIGVHFSCKCAFGVLCQTKIGVEALTFLVTTPLVTRPVTNVLSALDNVLSSRERNRRHPEPCTKPASIN